MAGQEVPVNFGGLGKDFSEYATARIVVLPVPFDGTSTWGKGADKGPDAIIEASRNMELYDIETNSEVYEKGIFTADAVSGETAEETVDNVYKRVKSLLDDGKFVVTLGGEHSVSVGAIQAHARFFEDVCVLHLDAHSDRRDVYEDSKYNHACAMVRAKEVADVVSVGIRSMDSSELPNVDNSKIFYADAICMAKDNEWIVNVLRKLGKNVYITTDLDVFDPAFVPATGTPEPGGLDWHRVTALLRAVAEHRNIVGFDVVELCPSEASKPSDFLAAKLVYKLLSYKFSA